MTSKASLYFSLYFSLVGSLLSAEDFGFARIYQSNMVFQQNQEIKVWGYGQPASEITIILEADQTALKKPSNQPTTRITYHLSTEEPASKIKKLTLANENGIWSTTFKPRKASFEPIAITASNSKGQTQTISNILMGEVWVCSGQSNMAWSGAEQSKLYQNSIPLHGIRYTRFDFTWPRPLNDLPEKIQWRELSSKSFGDFSKVPYFFSRALHLNLGVPIGVIINARGGTKGISWTSWEELSNIEAPEVSDLVSEYQEQLRGWETPESLARLAKAKLEVEKVWRPKAQKAIDAHWKKYDAFVREHLSPEKISLWEKRFADWQIAINEPKNSPGVLHNWKVWGLERHCKDLFKGTDLKPPEMDMSLWKSRPDDKDPRLGWSPPAGLFNAGANPLKHFSVAGMIFYQGENQNFGDLSALTGYRHIFPKIISAHRKLFNNPTLPFGIISLAGWGKKNAPLEMSMYGRYPYIMEIHAKTHEKMDNTGLIVTHDLGDSDIHPPNKRSVGDRAARWALGGVYGKELRFSPKFKFHSVEFKEGKASIRFKGTEEEEREISDLYSEWQAKRRKAPRIKDVLPWTLDGGDYLGFTIADQEQKWYPAKAMANLKERSIVVWSDLVKEPIAIRYGWQQFSEANLGTRAAPHPVFRSDDWPCPDGKSKGAKEEASKALHRREIKQHANALIKRLNKNQTELIKALGDLLE